MTTPWCRTPALATLLVAAASTSPMAPPLAGQRPGPLGTPAAGEPACGDALADAAGADWLGPSPLVADLTLDGVPDAARLGIDGERLLLLIARCEGDVVAERWYVPIHPSAPCDLRNATLHPGSLRIDHAAMVRSCAAGEGSDECIQLRQEDARREALMEAGGREIRVEVPACASIRFRWDLDRGGFMKLPG